MLITKRRRRRPDYEGQIRRHLVPIDPYMYPPGGIGGLEDLGIPAVDAVIAQTQTKLDALVLALKATAVLSGIACVSNLYLLIRDRHRDGTW
jgi:hypothetical protein